MKTPYLMPRVQLTLPLFTSSSAPPLNLHTILTMSIFSLPPKWTRVSSCVHRFFTERGKRKCIKAPRGKPESHPVVFVATAPTYHAFSESYSVIVGDGGAFQCFFLLFYFIFISPCILDSVPYSNVPDAGILSPSLPPLSQHCWILQSCFKVIHSMFSNSRYIFRASSRGSQSLCVTFRACGLYVFLIRIFLLMCSEYD